MTAKTIVFAHHKGGTGKTTSCISVAGFLAKAGKKVLVVDLDPQGNATSGLGIDKNTVDISMFHVMNKTLNIIEPILLNTRIENVHLAPAHSDLMIAEIKDESVLRKALIGARNSYDYILIDTPPGNHNLIMNGISAADHVILTLDPGIFALEGIGDFNDFLNKTENIDLDFMPDMIILTKAQSAFLKKADPAKEIRNELEDMFMKNIYIVPYSIDIYESQKKGLPVSHSFPKGNVGKAYKKIADDVLKL